VSLLGATVEPGGVRFRVWAPERARVELVIEGQPAPPLARAEDGTWTAFVPGLLAGARYRYRLDGEGPFPDPVSRFQPDGVHGPSEVIDPSTFAWTDGGWRGLALEDAAVYELHVGTFTPEGTFAAAAEKLPGLRDLGLTAVELMPVADFPGRWNWGYDGVALFAPARAYGRPDDLRRLVDAAHALGLAVLLDVVYNHFGPDGAYQGAFSPHYFTARHGTPWGQAVNLEGRTGAMVRAYFVENARHWIREYHLDGLRLDATDRLHDQGPRHFLAEIAAAAHGAAPERRVIVIAEDHRNLARMVQPEPEGWGLDAQWSDDFHHQLRRYLAGDSDGYFRDFAGTAADLARTIERGWLFTGQHSEYYGRPRGSDPAGIPPRRFTFYLQNHDQVGNRAAGERLHHRVDLATWRAASVLLLTAPEMPLLFMGQEWAASAPFQFFTDHEAELGRRVTEGRRREFARFHAFSDPAARETIPDPQAEETFRRSRLDWAEREREPHAGVVRLHRALLRLRREEPLLRDATWTGFRAWAADEDSLVLSRRIGERAVVVVARLRGKGSVLLDEVGEPLEVILQTEDADYATDAQPIGIADGSRGLRVRFERPGAVVLRLGAPGR